MPLSAREANALEYENFPLTENPFSAGRDNDDQLSAGVVGTIATAEVSEDGTLGNYEAVRIVPSTIFSDPATKPIVDLGDGAASVDGRTEFRLGVRKQNEQGATRVLTPWQRIRERDSGTSARDRPHLRASAWARQNYVTAGRILVMQVRHPTSNVTVDLSDANTEWEIEALGGS